MTIDCPNIETAVSARANGFQYVRSDDVAVVSVTCDRSAAGIPLVTALQACLIRFEPFLRSMLDGRPGARLFMFVTTPFWGHHNVVARRCGVWVREDWGWLPHASRSPSVEISRDVESRFAGLAQIGDSLGFEAADLVRRDDASRFLFVSSDEALTEERVRTMFDKVIPQGQSAIDWASVVDQIGAGADACIRIGGNFDDREVSIDAFIPAELLEGIRHVC